MEEYLITRLSELATEYERIKWYRVYKKLKAYNRYRKMLELFCKMMLYFK